MQLKFQRSQRTNKNNVIVYCLDARLMLSPEEATSIDRCGLGGKIIYNSEAAKRHLQAADAHGAAGQYFRGLAQTALAAMKLNISVGSLSRGHHIECYDLDELLEAEEMLLAGCQRVRTFLDTAATFDGREVLIDFSGSEPQVIARTAT